MRSQIVTSTDKRGGRRYLPYACCLLKWKDVDLTRRLITVKTAKTSQTVSIRIFPLLLDELASLPAKGKDLVFPEQAASDGGSRTG